MKIIRIFMILSALCAVSWAESPRDPISSFDAAKQIAREKIYMDHMKTLYCDCSYERAGRSGGRIHNEECGYVCKSDRKRGSRLEWEHIVPAYYFGHMKECWTSGNVNCVKHGRTYKGRKCCSKVDALFKAIEADLHNLAPSIGELNNNRSNHPYGIVDGEERVYGQCDFEIRDGFAEPRPAIRGDVARVWLYMAETYGIALEDSQKTMFLEWAAADPPDAWERTRDDRIFQVQGNRNHYISAQ
ncbi:endonuclease I [Desulfovibrio sulfodismutans]|uniref:Endonuclease I n=1 Tax=Desulfolutivibrio sulfodismutans TaxID=63561 RepID=A0A7K3NQK9_9BACT|nr:endonuclease [Desulfolutivibrio sulfodismutans]NDY57499.1 endonuclease I [Desulfolutivibrio sulfodismutans]